jgi:signal transduction histidine kinase
MIAWRKWRNRIQHSLLARTLVANLVPIVLSSACLLLLSAALFQSYVDGMVSLREEQASALAQMLARQCELPALVGDREELEQLARNLLAVDEVLYVVISSPANPPAIRVVARGFNVSDITKDPPRPGNAKPGIHVTAPLTKVDYSEAFAAISNSGGRNVVDWEPAPPEGVKLGSVRVGISNEAERRLMRREMARSLLLALVSLAVILAVQHRQLRKALSPLRDLIDAARRIASGDLRNRAPIAGRDEVADLSTAFNEMAANLEHSQQDLLRALEAAKESSRIKSEFMANISHEIRTPMNGIIGMTELAFETSLTAEQRNYLSMARQSAESLMALLNEILDFSKIEAGKLTLESVAFDPRRMVQEACQAFEVEASCKGIHLLADFQPDLPHRLIGDPHRLSQVLRNLLSNALKFTPSGEVRVLSEFGSGGQEQTVLRIRVRDTGIGIPADRQSRIFEAFTQADGSITRQYGGTGLGLAICTQLVAKMGGSISVQSAPGEGSEFWFSVPLEQIPAHSTLERAAKP